MRFTLALHFELDGDKKPKLTHTEFRYSGHQGDQYRAANEHRWLGKGKNSEGRFYWRENSYAFRGFTLLCIRHFLAAQNGIDDFTLEGKAQFVPALFEAIRTYDGQTKWPWLLGIAGVPELRSPKAFLGLFDFSTEHLQIKFRLDPCDAADFRFFLGSDEITDTPNVLGALADAIQGDEKNLLPLKLSEAMPPPLPLSLHIYSPGEGFLCVRTPETAKLLRERGMLPLRHNATAQLHVHFDSPQHFCLFAFGADRKVHAYVPHPNLPTGQARGSLTLPGDLIPNTNELVFEGTGGAESFLLLVSRHALTEQDTLAAQKTLAGIVSRIGLIQLSDNAVAFAKDDLLPTKKVASATKSLLLTSAQPFSGSLDCFLTDIQNEFADRFASFHFISVYRQDPPNARA